MLTDRYRVDVHSGASKSILVVEDECLIRLMVVDVLRDEGYDVIEASNADEAIDIFRSGLHVDLVFSDVKMPGTVDGLGLLDFVRTSYTNLPFIVTSGHLPKLPDASCDAALFLPKPYKMEQVLRLVEITLTEDL